MFGRRILAQGLGCSVEGVELCLAVSTTAQSPQLRHDTRICDVMLFIETYLCFSVTGSRTMIYMQEL